MGLDMYFMAKKYISDYREEDNEIREKMQALLPEISFPVRYIECEAIYWRKANAIHGWFVNNCQDGVDDCREVYVDREQLQELLEVIKTIQDDHSRAEELLSPVGGFFFGSTDLDEGYFEDLEYTQERLKKALEMSSDWDFYYHSSW